MDKIFNFSKYNVWQCLALSVNLELFCNVGSVGMGTNENKAIFSKMGSSDPGNCAGQHLPIDDFDMAKCLFRRGLYVAISCILLRNSLSVTLTAVPLN